eukprot:g7258.t1
MWPTIKERKVNPNTTHVKSLATQALQAGEPVPVCHSCPAGGFCPGGSIVLPKAGWWMSGGLTSTESCSFDASNLPKACGRNGEDCNNDEFSGEFYNKCGIKQRLIKCSLQNRKIFGHVCNGKHDKYACDQGNCVWKYTW